jgi:hypothetical protein
MRDLWLPALLGMTPISVLSTVYLCSGDPDRRRRAYQLLKLWFRR